MILKTADNVITEEWTILSTGFAIAPHQTEQIMPATTVSRRRRSRAIARSQTLKTRIRKPGATGWDCSIRLEHAVEGVLRRVEVHADSILSGPGTGLAASDAVAKAAKKLVRRCNPRETAALLASMSNPHRLVILHRLLQGPATYAQLQVPCNRSARTFTARGPAAGMM